MTPQPTPGSDACTAILLTHETLSPGHLLRALQEVAHLLQEGHRMTSSKSSLRAELRVLWILMHLPSSASQEFKLECFRRQDYLRRLLRAHTLTL